MTWFDFHRPFQPSSGVPAGWSGGIVDGLKAVVQMVFRPFRPLDFDIFDLLDFDLFNLRRVSRSDGPEGLVPV